jgi:hypothetical protein
LVNKQAVRLSRLSGIRLSRLPLSISHLAFNVQANNLDQSNGGIKSFGMKLAQPKLISKLSLTEKNVRDRTIVQPNTKCTWA